MLYCFVRLVGVKESNGDVTKIAKMVYETQGKGFQVMAGSAGFLLPSLCVGAVGGICALANCLPERVVELYQLFLKDTLKDAQELQHRLIGPNTGVTKQFGVPGLKKAMDWKGYYGGPCRKPLLPMETQQAEILQKIFERSQC